MRAWVTVIVVTALDGRSRVAVTVLSPPSSSIVAGVRTSVARGRGSLSVIVTVTPLAGATVRFVTVVDPVTTTVSPGSSTSSSTGARVNVAEPLVMRAAIVTVKSSTVA